MYAVTYNPGTFGSLLRNIISLEHMDDVAHQESHNNDVHSHVLVNRYAADVEVIHPYDRTKLDRTLKTIKPYFKDPDLKWFQWYRNEILFTKSDQHFKEHLRTYWNFKEPLCDISYNIDMTKFLINIDDFCADMASFLEKPKLKDITLHFIETKQKLNKPMYQDYLDRVVDTVRCLKENEQKDIGHFNNIELASVLCDFFYMDVTGTNNFCNNSPETNPNSTIEILSYVRN